MITLGKRGDLHARRQQLLTYVTKLHHKTLMKKLVNIQKQLHFRNCSLNLHHVMLSAMVDILVSLKLNHAVGMLRQWQLSN